MHWVSFLIPLLLNWKSSNSLLLLTLLTYVKAKTCHLSYARPETPNELERAEAGLGEGGYADGGTSIITPCVRDTECEKEFLLIFYFDSLFCRSSFRMNSCDGPDDGLQSLWFEVVVTRRLKGKRIIAASGNDETFAFQRGMKAFTPLHWHTVIKLKLARSCSKFEERSFLFKTSFCAAHVLLIVFLTTLTEMPSRQGSK